VDRHGFDERLSKCVVSRRGACLTEVGETCLKGMRGRVEFTDFDGKDCLRVA